MRLVVGLWTDPLGEGNSAPRPPSWIQGVILLRGRKGECAQFCIQIWGDRSPCRLILIMCYYHIHCMSGEKIKIFAQTKGHKEVNMFRLQWRIKLGNRRTPPNVLKKYKATVLALYFSICLFTATVCLYKSWIVFTVTHKNKKIVWQRVPGSRACNKKRPTDELGVTVSPRAPVNGTGVKPCPAILPLPHNLLIVVTDDWDGQLNTQLCRLWQNLLSLDALCGLLWRFGAVGSDVDRINEVTLRRARLVLGWVTVSGFNSRCGKFISV